MLVNNNIIECLCNDAGETRTQKARKYKEQGKVKLTKANYENERNFEIQAQVQGTEIYETYVEIKKGEVEHIKCNCQDYYNTYGVCKHSLATVLMFNDNGFEQLEDKNFPKVRNNTNKYSGFKQIVKMLYNEELEEIDANLEIELKNKGTIKIEPQIIYDKFTKEMKVEFKIGNKRMYKIKNLSEFYKRMINNEFYKYGDKLEFIHTKDMFEKDSQDLLEFLMKYAEIIAFTNSNANSNYRYYGNTLNESSIIIGNTAIDELFEKLKNRKVLMNKDYEKQTVEFIDHNPKIGFRLEKVSKNEYRIIADFDIYKMIILKGKEHKYVLEDSKMYRCDKEFEDTNLKLLKLFKENYSEEILLGKEQLGELFSVIIPKVKKAIKIDEQIQEEVKQYQPEKLGVKVFLDFDESDYIIADVKLCYGENEFNPLNQQEEKNFKYSRNVIEETKAMNVFRKTGFMYDVKNLRFILPNEEKIYEFLTNDINYYMKKFEVLATENFKRKEVIKPKIGSLGVKVENNLLEVDLEQLNINLNELEEIINKYKLKKKYHRLKDGSFLDLQDSKEIEFIDKLISGTDASYKELENGSIRLPVNRTLYLNQLLKEVEGTQIIKNREYKNIINNLDKDLLDEEQIPQELESILRPYQKTGFKWLKTLDKYKFGGILADDMGLGKTIQIIAILLNCKKNEDDNRTSIVVSPSSLSLNWKSEIDKFAPELKVKVIRGTASERKTLIENINKYDLVITSYDLLKRDIDIYKEKKYNFRFIIADEAQYLKNNNTKNAKAIKQLNADTRFALTGTPIENSLAELWSIFDFIMPGYLFSYKEFKSAYEMAIIKEENKDAMNKLKMLIEPFVLRRTKKEVLTELPEKTITVLNNEMEEEQRKIYLSYLVQAKQELQNEININGYEKSQIKILAALTRLRQICCHPGLFIEDYKDNSSKLEQCIEIIEDGITAGHKILLFSSYTSMFGIIEKELEKRNIKYFKLTGTTKIDERIELVDEFNQNDEIGVFLISLKAGGTGLNLTGADMVIHYDPWWNISAENQATDRAYRIGQKNNVQVYKLITKDSIEEKIYELQQKKAELTDNMLSTQTTFINKLSKEDIMNLFG
ncbi:MAG: SNF2 helicase associated domain-containing protein [Clostridia bacterium]|nr:SNF2 helicase associated domain-containing protein [Clostridia bacterium]